METDAPLTGRKTPDERKELLARKIHSSILLGGRVESQGDFEAVLVKGRRPNHVLHLVLSILTAGLWILVWILMAVFGGEERVLFTVDEFGNINTQKLPRS